MKGDHVRLMELSAGALGLSDAHKRRVEVDAINREAVVGGEEVRVLARAAGHVEDAAAARVGLPEQRGNLLGFRASSL